MSKLYDKFSFIKIELIKNIKRMKYPINIHLTQFGMLNMW